MNMMSDEEKLKELFDMEKKSGFNVIIKKAKFFSIMRTATVSFMIFIIISCVVFILNAVILNKMSNKKQKHLYNLFEIAMPNSYIGNIQSDDRIMIGEIDYVRYRFLGRKPVIDGEYKEEYTYMPLINGIYGDMGKYLFYSVSEDSKESLKYNKVGKRVMEFYHPSVEYENYINDLRTLDEISDDKVMEIALSFDKSYKFEEIKDMIPADVTLNWYWVDTFNENELNKAGEKNLYEDDVYGIKALDSRGNLVDNPQKCFIDAVKRELNTDVNDKYKELFNTLSNGKDEIKEEDLRIIGVVVSGDAKTLKSLRDKNYIKAATLGAVADKY